MLFKKCYFCDGIGKIFVFDKLKTCIVCKGKKYLNNKGNALNETVFVGKHEEAVSCYISDQIDESLIW